MSTATQSESSVETAANSWVSRYSTAALVLTLLLGVVTLVYYQIPTDPDLWWHVRTGQLILASGVPNSDIYSYTASGNLWIAHSWLTEVLMYLVQSTFGFGLLVLLYAAVAVATYWLTYMLARRAGAGPWLALALLVVRLVIDVPICWGLRTQNFSNLFFTIFFFILLQYRLDWRGRTTNADGLAAWIGPDKRLWLLPALMLLWANMHAGFSAALILLALWVVGETANAAFGWQPAPPLRPLLAVSGVTALAVIVNPYGVTLLLYPLFFLTSPGQHTLGYYIQEWAPIDLRDPMFIPFIITVLSLLAAFAIRRKTNNDPPRPQARWPILAKLPFTPDAVLLAALALFFVMALKALRLQPQWAAAWAVVMSARLPQVWPALGRQRQESANGAGRLNLIVAVGTLALLAFVMLSRPNAQLGPQPHDDTYPVQAVAYLDAHPEISADPLFNDWYYGGYLIAKRWPAHKDFIDGRADPFQGAPIEDYAAAVSGGDDWQAVFAKYGIRSALLPRKSGLGKSILAAPGWQQVCCDSGPAVLLIKR